MRMTEAVSRTLRALPGRIRTQLAFLGAGILACALLELFTAGAVAMFASLLANADSVNQLSYFDALFQWLGIDPRTEYFRALMAAGSLSVGLLAVKGAAQSVRLYAVGRMVPHFDSYFGQRIISGVLAMPYEWYLRQNSADLFYLFGSRIYVGRTFLGQILSMVSDMAVVAFLLSGLFLARPVISLIIFGVLGGCSLLLYLVFRRSLDHVARFCMRHRQALQRTMVKCVQALKDIRLFAVEDHLVGDFRAAYDSLAKREGQQALLSYLPTAVLEILGIAGLVLLVLLMHRGAAASDGGVVGTVALLAVAAWRILPAVSRILSSFTQARKCLPEVELYYRNLDAIEADKLDLRETRAVAFENEIRLENLAFRYHGAKRDVLADVDLAIRKGQAVGLVGRSGAGKSTLVNLLTGLLQPSQGRVLVDGRDCSGSVAWARRIGYVPQEPFIFDGTVAQNIAFGLPDDLIDTDRVMACCRQAAVDFLDPLEEGIHRPIGEQGARISGGQKQRIAIARALYNDPEIMVFDEATSNLDSKNEKAIQETLLGLKGQRTLVIIAHRLSTVEQCDFLVWLKDGRMRMQGPPAEVLAAYRAEERDDDSLDPEGCGS